MTKPRHPRTRRVEVRVAVPRDAAECGAKKRCRMRRVGAHALVAILLPLAGASCAKDLPRSGPALAELDEPLAWRSEPDDERQRHMLDPGAFSGLEVERATDSIDELLGASDPGLRVTRIVENSPAAAAGLEVGDVLLSARTGDAEAVELHYPSEWRAIELAAEPGTEVRLRVDRAAIEREITVELIERVRPAARSATERIREEDKVGIVLRTATEFEARRAGLAPGAGVVLVGMARSSPWRAVDIRYGDLIARVDGEPIADPQVLLQVIQEAEPGAYLELDLYRDGEPQTVIARASRRVRRITEVRVPLLFRYEAARDRSEIGALLGLFHWEATPVAWRFRLFWLIRFGAGDTEELLDVR